MIASISYKQIRIFSLIIFKWPTEVGSLNFFMSENNEQKDPSFSKLGISPAILTVLQKMKLDA